MNVDGNDQVGTLNNENMKKLYDEFDEEEIDDVGGNLNMYLEAPREKRDDEAFDILKWWSLKSNAYKVLVLMAKDILVIPVSTVSSAQDWLRASNICVDIKQLLEDVEKYEEELSDRSHESIKGIIASKFENGAKIALEL
ncbi:hypothetical protein F3Y22_tig00110819pilonHSYRG00360 [Hibiscus syriacus]|uniref:HAT C-terminal dimerisation domain-containing protein n=1 Tax=Hibiscus syriacus TaxID=106335 RepID=A0A6A2ZN05_HIBSY|nr:hypothetical protein F3Y22_tig00110819pilonHSYRG00360 [Hibiscus syriacus]